MTHGLFPIYDETEVDFAFKGGMTTIDFLLFFVILFCMEEKRGNHLLSSCILMNIVITV